MNASADGQGQVFQAGRDIVISGQPHVNARKLTVLNAETAAQVLTEMVGRAETRNEAVFIVADMEPEAAASRLAVMPSESAAQILARMDHELASQRLLLIPTFRGGAIFGHLPARVAVKLVRDAPPETTLKLLTQMTVDSAVAILSELPNPLVAELLIEIPARLATEKFVSAQLMAFPFTRPHATRWLAGLSDAQAARVVAAAPADATVVALANMPGHALAEHGATLLSKVDDDYLTTVLTLIMPAWRAGDLLSGLADHRVALALASVPETRCAVLLAQVPEERAAEIVRQMPQAKQQRIKPHLW